jgi:hypothetical protein
MMWVLKERKDQFNRNNYYDLLDTVEYLERQEPRVVMLMLQGGPQAEESLFEATSLEKENLLPKDLAFHLVNQLHHWLAKDDLGYPPKILQAVWPLT